MADVLDNPLELVRTVVPGYHLVRYRGCGADAAWLELNAASMEMPRINEAYVDYACPAFASPWLKGEYGSGVVTVQKGARSLVLDLNPAGAP